jgi:hypothetical protein
VAVPIVAAPSAPAAALIYQFREVLAGRQTRRRLDSRYLRGGSA